MEKTGTRVPPYVVLLVPGGLALLAGLDAALLLLGLPAPVRLERWSDVHGPLMVLGFVGTLVALERAVAVRRAWAFASPALLGAGGLTLLTAAPPWVGRTGFVLGAAALVGIFINVTALIGEFAFPAFVSKHPEKNYTRLTIMVCAIGTAAPGVRLRLGSLEPRVVTEEFCLRLKGFSNLCPQFHLSLQSGCDTVLERMRRKYDTRRYFQSVELLKTHFPGCAVTTDMIVAFP